MMKVITALGGHGLKTWILETTPQNIIFKTLCVGGGRNGDSSELIVIVPRAHLLHALLRVSA